MTDPFRTELLELALEAASQAGALLRDQRPADLGVAATKSSPIDVVTEMDLAAEKLITGFLAEHRPHDAFLAEEGSLATAGQRGGEGDGTGVRWIIDPLDGTVNYLYGLPNWAVSIAAELDGEVVAGVVAVPPREETFRAVLDEGAHLGGQPLSCRPAAPLGQSLIGTGFSYVTEHRAAQAEVVRKLITEVRDVRRSGSAAADLCDVAAGRLDGYYERGLNPWDYAAGDLIAREAGARTGGRPGRLVGTELTVAASPETFARLQPLLEEFTDWSD